MRGPGARGGAGWCVHRGGGGCCVHRGRVESIDNEWTGYIYYIYFAPQGYKGHHFKGLNWYQNSGLA